MRPDYPGSEPEETPDYPGTDPVPTPGVGEGVATVTVRDDAPLLCVDIAPEGSGPTEITCVNRGSLGPADGQIPRGDTPIFVLEEDETPDVPGTDPMPLPAVPGTPSQDVPDAPGTDPVSVPDVPGTPSQNVPDVPPVHGESLGEVPHPRVTIDASYHYGGSRLAEQARVLGQPAWGPFRPGDGAWFPANGANLEMVVPVAVYEDSKHVATVPVTVLYLGQAIAAVEKTAGMR